MDQKLLELSLDELLSMAADETLCSLDLSHLNYEEKTDLIETIYSEYLNLKSGNNTQALLMHEKMLCTLIKTYGH